MIENCETIVILGLIMVLLAFAFNKEKFHNNPVNQEIARLNQLKKDEWYSAYAQKQKEVRDMLEKKTTKQTRSTPPKLPKWLHSDVLKTIMQNDKFNVFPYIDKKHTPAKPPPNYRPASTDKGTVDVIRGDLSVPVGNQQ